jgi:hypothetical protein
MQMSKVDMKNNVTKNTIVVAESMTLMIEIINEEKRLLDCIFEFDQIFSFLLMPLR